MMDTLPLCLEITDLVRERVRDGGREEKEGKGLQGKGEMEKDKRQRIKGEMV